MSRTYTRTQQEHRIYDYELDKLSANKLSPGIKVVW